MSKITNPLIISFDIHPQSSPSAQKSPNYAVAIFHDVVQETYACIPRNKLIKIIRRVKPHIIATDNLLELAATEKGVIDFLSRIPSKTRVIQVTGSPVHGMNSLIKLAKEKRLQVNQHPTQMETAVLIAQLASMGVGTEISALAQETQITVSRARNIGPGGSSQARYQRRMHGAIQQVARNILGKLTKAGADFDHYETRTSHGWARCTIHVYDSFDNVNKIAQSEINRLAGVAIRLTPVKRRSILYLPHESKEEIISPRRLLVVGIDAGTTVGIAIADVSGHLVALKSGRSLSRGDIVRYLVEFGKPILIAADVTPASSFVEKLSTSLKSHLFSPPKMMTVIEKRELAKSFTADSKLRARNAHQRDALAAVAKFFQVNGAKLELLNKHLQESKHKYLVSKALTLVLQGISIHDALEQSEIIVDAAPSRPEVSEPVHPIKNIPAPEELQRIIERLQRQSLSLQRQLEYERNQHNQSLVTQKQIEKNYRQTQRELERLLNKEQREQRLDERLRQKDIEIQRLVKKVQEQARELENAKRTLTNLKLMRRLEICGEVQPVLILSHFTQEEIRHFCKRYSQKRGKIVLIQDPSGGGSSTADQLIQFGVQVVITHGKMSHLALQQFDAAHIPVIDAESLRITIVDEFAVVDNERLRKEIQNKQKSQQAIDHEAAAEALERLIEEYRQERRHENSENK